jgi:hypothetical protein
MRPAISQLEPGALAARWDELLSALQPLMECRNSVVLLMAAAVL